MPRPPRSLQRCDEDVPLHNLKDAVLVGDSQSTQLDVLRRFRSRTTDFCHVLQDKEQGNNHMMIAIRSFNTGSCCGRVRVHNDGYTHAYIHVGYADLGKVDLSVKVMLSTHV